MKAIFQQIGCLFVVATACVGETSTENEHKASPEGEVNVGEILHSAGDVEDEEASRKMEILSDKIETMRKAEEQERDFSASPTDELLRVALDTTSNNSWTAAVDELSKREDETKAAIARFLQNDRPFQADVAWFSRLPALAKSFGAEYQAQVTKEILFHPLARRYDQVLLIQGNLIDNLAVSPRDESSVLDRLIAQGRLERGSELEVKWRKTLSHQARPEKNGASDMQRRDKQNKSSESTPLQQASGSDTSPRDPLAPFEGSRAPIGWLVLAVVVGAALGLRCLLTGKQR